MQNSPKPALFLDRDGVINVDRGYVHKIQDFEWVPGARECIAHFNQNGWWVFVVTNQSGIARGFFSESDLQKLHDHIRDELATVGAHIDAFYHCAFLKDAPIKAYDRESALRKPAPGMLHQAMETFPVNVEKSLMIGDKQSDILAGEAANVSSFLFTGGNLLDFALGLSSQARE